MLDGVSEIDEESRLLDYLPTKKLASERIPPDELIINQVGGHANQSKVSLALANHLVARGVGN